MNQKEIKQKDFDVVKVNKQMKSIILFDPKTKDINGKQASDNKLNSQEYIFNNVYDENSTNQQIYEESGKMTVDNVFKGYNSTMFAYGQTGSGKTYTIQGSQQNPGVCYRAIQDIFQRISDSRQNGCKYLVTCQFFEIYNEQAKDLITNKQIQSITSSKNQKSLHNKTKLSQYDISTYQEAIDLYEKGQKNRVTKSTKMNDVSSRSHSIFQIILECQKPIGGGQYTITQGTLSFVDLAGSERISKTKAEGKTRTEGININKSLFTLGRVIKALSQKQKKDHVPYRESLLTTVLANSLGGNAKTLMLICISPASSNYGESNLTLIYGCEAKKVVNNARINDDPKDSKIRELTEKVKSLEQKVQVAEQNQSVNPEYIQSLKAQIKQFTDELEVSQDQVDNLTLQIENLQKLINSYKSQIEELKRNLESRTQELYETQKELEESQSNYSSSKAQLKLKDKEIQDKDKLLQDKDEQLTQSQAKLQDYMKLNVEFKTKNEDYESQLKDRDLQISQLMQSNVQSSEQILQHEDKETQTNLDNSDNQNNQKEEQNLTIQQIKTFQRESSNIQDKQLEEQNIQEEQQIQDKVNQSQNTETQDQQTESKQSKRSSKKQQLGEQIEEKQKVKQEEEKDTKEQQTEDNKEDSYQHQEHTEEISESQINQEMKPKTPKTNKHDDNNQKLSVSQKFTYLKQVLNSTRNYTKLDVQVQQEQRIQQIQQEVKQIDIKIDQQYKQLLQALQIEYIKQYNIQNVTKITPQENNNPQKRTYAMYLVANGYVPVYQIAHNPELQDIDGYTVAMLLAKSGRIPQRYWDHDPTIRNKRNDTVAMWLAGNGIIPPKQWQHEPSCKNIFGETVAILLSDKGIIPPQIWMHDINQENIKQGSIKYLLQKHKLPVPREWRDGHLSIFDQACYGIIPDITGHRPDEQDPDGFTVAMILLIKQKFIPYYWQHDLSIKNKYGQTIEDIAKQHNLNLDSYLQKVDVSNQTTVVVKKRIRVLKQSGSREIKQRLQIQSQNVDDSK